MAFIPADQFPHNKVLSGTKVKLNDLDDNLKKVITLFNQKHNGYKLNPSEKSEGELMALSTIVTQHIYDYYIDEEDQEVEIKGPVATPAEVKAIVEEIKEEEKKPDAPVVEPTPEPIPDSTPTPEPATPTPQPVQVPDIEPANRNEKALYLLFKEGVTSGITRSMLKEKGFDTDLASIRGCKIGSYKLYKEFSDTTYNLDKI